MMLQVEQQQISQHEILDWYSNDICDQMCLVLPCGEKQSYTTMKCRKCGFSSNFVSLLNKKPNISHCGINFRFKTETTS